MNSATVVALISMWQGKISGDSASLLQMQIGNIPDEKFSTLASIQLKNPVVGLILGLFFGMLAIDRFYKGDIGIGIAKLFLGWVTFGLWTILDLFLVWRGIKKDNFQKIQNAILALQ